MVQDPERFIQEKLAKKTLSPNTIRDLIMAALLIALQGHEKDLSSNSEQAEWRETKAVEIREKASRAFEKMGAPFEYPSRAQLIDATERLKKDYHWDQMPPRLRDTFEDIYGLILSKFQV